MYKSGRYPGRRFLVLCVFAKYISHERNSVGKELLRLLTFFTGYELMIYVFWKQAGAGIIFSVAFDWFSVHGNWL